MGCHIYICAITTISRNIWDEIENPGICSLKWAYWKRNSLSVIIKIAFNWTKFNFHILTSMLLSFLFFSFSVSMILETPCWWVMILGLDRSSSQSLPFPQDDYIHSCGFSSLFLRQQLSVLQPNYLSTCLVVLFLISSCLSFLMYKIRIITPTSKFAVLNSLIYAKHLQECPPTVSPT